MAKSSSPAYHDAVTASRVSESSVVIGHNHPLHSSPPSLSHQSPDIHEPTTLDSDDHEDLSNKVSAWRAGNSAAKAMDSFPPQQHPPHCSVTFGESQGSHIAAERFQPRSGRNFPRGNHAIPGDSHGNSSGHFFKYSMATRQPSDHVNVVQALDNDVYLPVYRPDRGSREYDESLSNSFPVRPGDGEQPMQQVPIYSEVVRNGSGAEGRGDSADTHATGIFPKLLSLYGFPATKHHSHSSSAVSPKITASRTNSDSFQTLGMIGLRKRHDSLLSTDTDLMELDNEQETNTSSHVLDIMKRPFRSKTPKDTKDTIIVIRKNVVGVLYMYKGCRVCGINLFLCSSCFKAPELHPQVGEGAHIFWCSQPSHRVSTCLSLQSP